MGAWGAGNFDDDAALDWIEDQVKAPIVEMIDCEISNHDEGNGTEIMAAVEVLAILCEHTPLLPPELVEIVKWRQAYLETWNGYIDELDPKPGYKEDRLRIIEATFDRLAAVAQKHK